MTQIIEQNMTALDGLLYMVSTSDNDGNVSIALTFASGTNPDIAQVQVQNKLQQAVPLLPQIVQQQGISVSKSTGSFLIAVGFVSEDGSMSAGDIGDYLATNVVDPMSRVEGVGGVQLFGAKYAMRIWLDPDKLNAYGLTPGDVIAAIQAQNAQISVGQLGDPPSVPGQQLNATVTALGRLQTPEQFGNIVLRSNTDGSTPAPARRGARRARARPATASAVEYNGKPASGIGVTLATGANALRTVARCQGAAARDSSRSFPRGPEGRRPLRHHAVRAQVDRRGDQDAGRGDRAGVPGDVPVPAEPARHADSDHRRAGGAAGHLRRACRWPAISINMLTMFAVVLAIGLLVDDAIVVVENVERLMVEEGLSPMEATRKSMDQITGALIGIATVLSAVFIPMAFLNGSTGVIYRQFSITIVSAMVLSVIVAMVLTPALCATLLKPVAEGRAPLQPRLLPLVQPRLRCAAAAATRASWRRMIARPARYMLVYLALASLMGLLFMRLPTAFLPDEDQGVSVHAGADAGGCDAWRAPSVRSTRSRTISSITRRTRSPRSSPWRASASAARAERRHRLRAAQGLGASANRPSSESRRSRDVPSAR